MGLKFFTPSIIMYLRWGFGIFLSKSILKVHHQEKFIKFKEFKKFRQPGTLAITGVQETKKHFLNGKNNFFNVDKHFLNYENHILNVKHGEKLLFECGKRTGI